MWFVNQQRSTVYSQCLRACTSRIFMTTFHLQQSARHGHFSVVGQYHWLSSSCVVTPLNTCCCIVCQVFTTVARLAVRVSPIHWLVAAKAQNHRGHCFFSLRKNNTELVAGFWREHGVETLKKQFWRNSEYIGRALAIMRQILRRNWAENIIYLFHIIY